MSRSAALDHASLRSDLLQRLAGNEEAFPAQLAEHFPHVLQRFLSLWNQSGLERYFSSLLLPPQPGAQGFPEPVLLEILTLKAHCHAQGMLAASALSPSSSPPVAGAEADHDEAAAILDRFQRR